MKTPDGNNQTLAMVISIAFVLLLVLAIAGIFVWKCKYNISYLIICEVKIAIMKRGEGVV